MKIVLKQVGCEPENVEITGHLEEMQKIVGGYIEAVPLGKDVMLVCNEDGKLNGSEFNFVLKGDFIFGDVFFCGTSLDELTEEADLADCPLDADGIKEFMEWNF